MLEFILEFFDYVNKRKKFLLLPVFVVLIMFGVVIFVSSGSVLAPFLYTLF